MIIIATGNTWAVIRNLVLAFICLSCCAASDRTRLGIQPVGRSKKPLCQLIAGPGAAPDQNPGGPARSANSQNLAERDPLPARPPDMSRPVPGRAPAARARACHLRRPRPLA